MKKTQLLLSLSALALLAGCGDAPNASSSVAPKSDDSSSVSASNSGSEASSTSISSDQSSSSASASNSEATPTGSWTETEQNLMKELFGGNVLPYLNMVGQYQVEQDSGDVYITGKTSMSIGEISVLFNTADFEVNVTAGDDKSSVEGRLVMEDYSYLYVYIELSGDGAFSLFASYYQSVDAWPSQIIAQASALTGVTSIPELPADAYICYAYNVEGDSYAFYIECYGDGINEGTEATYANILTGAGFVLNELYHELLGVNLYEHSDGTCIEFGYNDPGFYINAYYEEPQQSEEFETFPSEAVASFVEDVLGLDPYSIPAYTADSYYFDTNEESGECCVFSYYDTLEDAMAIESAYTDALTDLGWAIDDSQYDEDGLYATHDGSDIELLYFAWTDDDGPYFCIYVFEKEEEGPVVTEESFDDAIPGATSVISFANENMLLIKNASSSLWNNGAFSFVVNKGTSTMAVGNGTFFSDPLRTYQNQQIEIHSEVAFSQIVFDATAKSEGSLPQFSAPSAGSFDGLTLTFDAPVTSVSFSVTSNQARFYSASVTFAAE